MLRFPNLNSARWERRRKMLLLTLMSFAAFC
jgi:hypothetical protein